MKPDEIDMKLEGSIQDTPAAQSKHGCCAGVVQAQAGVQALMRPAMWVPGVRTLHLYEEVVILDKVNSFAALQDALSKCTPRTGHMQLHDINVVDTPKRHLLTATVRCFTKSGWLDLVDVKATKKGENQIRVEFRSYSTGFLPLSIPGACLLNLAFFWVPFSDNGFPRGIWIKSIKKALEKAGVDTITPVSSGRAC